MTICPAVRWRPVASYRDGFYPGSIRDRPPAGPSTTGPRGSYSELADARVAGGADAAAVGTPRGLHRGRRTETLSDPLTALRSSTPTQAQITGTVGAVVGFTPIIRLAEPRRGQYVRRRNR